MFIEFADSLLNVTQIVFIKKLFEEGEYRIATGSLAHYVCENFNNSHDRDNRWDEIKQLIGVVRLFNTTESWGDASLYCVTALPESKL